MMKLTPKSKNDPAKEKFSVGLDIGTSAVKLVRLKFVQDAVELCAFDLQPAQLELVELLKKIKQSQGVEAVNIGFSGPATVIRDINFPRMGPDELKQALKFEAQKNIPFSVEEVNLDACILREDLPDNKMLVLIAAAKKDLVSQRLKIIEDAGLKASIIDIDSIALVNAFNFNYPLDEALKHKAIVLLNIGATITNLNITEDGIPRLSRDIHIAGNSLTQKIADMLGMDFKAAENLKAALPPDKTTQVLAALESVLTNLTTEIRTSFDYYESQNASSVARIFLSGGGSAFGGFKDALANLLGIEVEYWDPLKNINLADNIDAQKVKALSAQLAVAVGLALRT